MLAVSRDESTESRPFARKYGIAYPLLADPTGAVSRAYTGVDDLDHTVPGVVVIRRDGKIVYRQVASTKDDRVTATEILATADRTLGTSGIAFRPATPAIDRVQLRLEVGTAAIDREPRLVIAAGTYVPFARYFVGGAEVRQSIRDTARFVLDGSLGVRLPIYGDIGAIQLTGMVGTSLFEGVYAGGRLGLWFAYTPRWALHADVGAAANAGSTELFATFGVSRLFGR